MARVATSVRESCSRTTLHVPIHLPSAPRARHGFSPWPRGATVNPGDHRQLAIPVPIPNTVVKQLPPMIVLMRESRLSPGSSKARSSCCGPSFLARLAIGLHAVWWGSLTTAISCVPFANHRPSRRDRQFRALPAGIFGLVRGSREPVHPFRRSVDGLD